LWLAGATTVALAGVNAARITRMRRQAGVEPGDHDHLATVGEGLGPALRLLVLGDSAARGYGLAGPAEALPFQVATRLAKATGRRIETAAMATDGHTTVDVLEHQVPLVKAHRPDVIVLMVGVNDAFKGRKIAQVRDDTRRLLTALRQQAPEAALAFVTCPDLRSAPGVAWPLNAALGWRCKRVSRAQRAVADDLGVLVVPLERPLREHYGGDGFHPGASGIAVVAEMAAAVLVDEETSWTSV
jgi:lysophospholipase L1-like esterase